MNVIQASILNNYCETHPEVLVVFVQANNSLSVYYRNNNNKIAHKFSSVERSKELEAEQVWVSLQNFEDNYKDLLKYFHPDTYKGKRKNYELTECIFSITSIKQSKSHHKEGVLYELLNSFFTGPKSEFISEPFELPSFVKLLGSRDFFKQVQDWFEGIRWHSLHKEQTSWFEEIF